MNYALWYPIHIKVYMLSLLHHIVRILFECRAWNSRATEHAESDLNVIV